MFGIGEGISAIGNIGMGVANYFQQKKQFEYQKELNQKMMDREDNAVQRRAKDLEAAGLSKTLAAGGGASSQPLSAGSAPQLDSGMMNGISNVGRSAMQSVLDLQQLSNMKLNNDELNQKILTEKQNRAITAYDFIKSKELGIRYRDTMTLERYLLNSIIAPKEDSWWSKAKKAGAIVLDGLAAVGSPRRQADKIQGGKR